ncbi:MAG: glycine cleavage system aminomethyltransferase GcvT [Candidatus Acetothermia bacterium]
MKEFDNYPDLLADVDLKDLEQLDPFVNKLIEIEEERESKKLILIPSESVAPPAVREALGSVFNNVYAEGYPREEMTMESEPRLQDLANQLNHYRRYANRRFYKGVEYVDLLESLAQERASRCFATEEVSPDQIFVNVQALSGTAANLAIYDTFVQPGGTVMGLSLDQGGHLSHGSEFNLTGKRYDIVSYESDPQTGKLDYDQIHQLAQENEPEMIIAGYTSFSWAPDWDRFREIADEVGAILLADIAHTAGMAIAGAYPNPIGKAHVTMCTTHKTIGGPRGAIIMTTDKEKADRLDEAIFPGAQGGPHPNKFAAMAVAFRLAQTEAFTEMQHKIVKNASHLANSLQEKGLELAYRGTDTHLLVIDLTKIESSTEFTMMGEVASRILDLARIVSNKNTIPGDESAAVAHGLRLGTPWITQRGMGKEEIEEIADILALVLQNIKPFSYIGLTNPLSRGKVDLDLLLEARERVAELVTGFPPQSDRVGRYPYFYLHPDQKTDEEQEFESTESRAEWNEAGLLKVRGHRPKPFLNQLSTRDLLDGQPEKGKTTALLDEEGQVLEIAEVIPLEKGQEYLVITTGENHEKTVDWLRAIADGYVIFDKDDLFRKVEGPAVVQDLTDPKENQEETVCFGPFQAEEFFETADPDAAKESGMLSSVEFGDESFRYYISENRPGDVFLWGPRSQTSTLQAHLDLKTKGEKQALGTSGKELYQQRPELFDLTAPYYVGIEELERELPEGTLPPAPEKTFDFSDYQDVEGQETRKTPLFERHQELGARMAEFADWKMPFWYSTIIEEHRAVRENAGLFDVGHMGVFGFYGEGATSFLDLVTSNYVRWLNDNEAQYTYLLDPRGGVVDDAMVYRLSQTRYLMVVNAANAEKNWDWLTAVNSGEYVIDPDRPWIKPEQEAELINLRSEAAGERARLNIALQGPESRKILLELIDSSEGRERLVNMSRNEVYGFSLSGIDTIVATTGYTGEEVGYELLVHPEQAVSLWDALLEKGEQFGLLPVGLGGRDSTRIEAGLPLYGHELAGKHQINPVEAKFGAYVKLHKPYFVGRDRYLDIPSTDHVDHQVVRFKIVDSSARMVREDSPVFDKRGSFVGRVTSCAKTGKTQIGMAYLEKGPHTEEGTQLKIAPSLAGKETTKLELKSGSKLPPIYKAQVLPRFPETEGGVPGMKAGE